MQITIHNKEIQKINLLPHKTTSKPSINQHQLKHNTQPHFIAIFILISILIFYAKIVIYFNQNILVKKI